jgi:hypothetical protein
MKQLCVYPLLIVMFLTRCNCDSNEFYYLNFNDEGFVIKMKDNHRLFYSGTEKEINDDGSRRYQILNYKFYLIPNESKDSCFEQITISFKKPNDPKDNYMQEAVDFFEIDSNKWMLIDGLIEIYEIEHFDSSKLRQKKIIKENLEYNETTYGSTGVWVHLGWNHLNNSTVTTTYNNSYNQFKASYNDSFLNLVTMQYGSCNNNSIKTKYIKDITTNPKLLEKKIKTINIEPQKKVFTKKAIKIW